MELVKKKLLVSFLELILFISDKEFQRRNWIGGLGPEAKEVLKAFHYDLQIPNYEIPTHFTIEMSANRLNIIYVHPTNKHSYLRVSPAKQNSIHPSQRISYVTYKINGKSTDKEGRMVENNSPEAYIPSGRFVYRDFGEMIDREQILEEFFKTIFRLSDEKYQQRVQIDGKGVECNEMDDAVCDFFDDGIAILESYQNFGISEHEYKLLVELQEKLDAFVKKSYLFFLQTPSQKLIILPEWQEVQQLSKKILYASEFFKKYPLS